jgi:RNA polymerase sigma-70 factor, ECF subfamily
MSAQDDLYRKAVSEHGGALERFARAYEAGPEDRRDLLQEIHIALWRSFAGFDERCSLRTWAYRVAHNIAVTHIYRSRKTKKLNLLSIEDLEESEKPAASDSPATTVETQLLLGQLYALIKRLNPTDRQIIILYLEGLDAVSIGEITGISPGYAATKIHRIKRILAERFLERGDNHDYQ